MPGTKNRVPRTRGGASLALGFVYMGFEVPSNLVIQVLDTRNIEIAERRERCVI